MSSSKKKKIAGVLGHWYSLAENFTTSTQDFYKTIETELKDRRVPDLRASRKDIHEGGKLSPYREYLRLTRDRLVFEICAAPFGTSFFFSCRMTEKPGRPGLVAFLGLLCTAIAYAAIYRLVGPMPAIGALAICSITSIIAVQREMGGDETYYREDSRIMYHDTVMHIVKTEVEKITSATGVRLLSHESHSPFKAPYRKVEDKKPLELANAAA